jgi:hypothetical protein
MAAIQYSETATDYEVAITLANTEYYLDIPPGTKAIEVQARGAVDIRHSFVTGKVAGSVAPYRTLKSGGVYAKDGLYLGGRMYFACGTGSQVVEVRAWR